MAFDLFHFDGLNLRDLPLSERQKKLANLDCPFKARWVWGGGLLNAAGTCCAGMKFLS